MMNLSYNSTISNQWETFCEKLYETSVATVGHTTRKHQGWFDENDAEISSLLEERRRAHDAFLSHQKKTENCAIHKQNLNYKKATNNTKCLVGQES